MESPSKLFGAVLGLTAFAVAIIAGLATGVDGASTIQRAIVSMFACYFLGTALGAVAGQATTAFIRGYVKAHPVGDMDAAIAAYDFEPEETGEEVQ